MNNFLRVFLFFIISSSIYGQALPLNRYYKGYILDEVNEQPSFAYSLRKLKKTYTGFSLKVRRSVDNAEANVNFDTNDVVSANSTVVITAAGSSSLTVGQILNFNAFQNTQTLLVTTWYDQSVNVYNATQLTATAQPILVLNSAGLGNNLPSILFEGITAKNFLAVGQPIQNLINLGVNGSFLLVVKPSRNVNQFSFGMVSATGNWRWSFHLNWSDGNSYFDAAEVCCGPGRAFNNAVNLNLYKQYSFVRGTNYKTSRINNAPTTVTNVTAGSVTQTGGDFYIGSTINSPAANNGFSGNLSEVIMFPTDLIISRLSPIESNQVNFWQL